MIKRFFQNLTILPRWIIIIIDLMIILESTAVAYMLRFNFEWEAIIEHSFLLGLAVSGVAGLISNLATRSYAGIVRYTGIEDGKRIASNTILSMLLLSITNLLSYYNTGINLIPYSVLLITFPFAFFQLFFYRLFVKELFAYIKSVDDKSERTNVAVFGAGSLGISVKQMIESSPESRLRLIALIEDDIYKTGKKIQGHRIFRADELQALVQDRGVQELIIAVNNLTPERKNQLIDDCLRLGIKVRAVPPASEWIRGQLSLKQIKEVRIEDLLGRDVIDIGQDELEKQIKGKVICVTGAAGSIGSELCRQIIHFAPKRLVLIDQSESPLFNAEYDLKKMGFLVDLSVYICDITNAMQLEKILVEERPETIFHAAAYKHVPLMERNPTEAVICNIFGTRILADLAVKTGVKKFVMISTDKAVRPTSIMGCTKRIAEIYVQALYNHLQLKKGSCTSFVTTRFGNVLGSNGSVIPIFRKQIEAGGPITVTHPEIVRYFMTIPEACRLVLEAGVMGYGGEIYIFDMGKPVKIYDLARQMVKLSGLEVGKDIDIIFTGLREGEKLFEELLNDSENTVPTHHDKIMKAKVAIYEYNQINNYLDLLDDLVKDKNELKVVALMKDIVPEYKSNYSRFEVLDKDQAI
ncbi:MAG TPA: nucleoside-diphosphate sugar epimerase/dehydratase [Cyclobacteriaceae bacterium]|nr:nucleoside-diphosphate sugar epimerase/dehydratase [Cyclobacteriaceae bacterium]